MADANCSHELNKQIQGLQARLSQAENNIHSHFIGISQLVTALADTPASAAAAAMSAVYNLQAVGFAALQQLKTLLPEADTKKLMMEAAGALIDTMAAQLDGLVDSVEAAAMGTVNAALDTLNTSIQNVTNAEAALTAALQGGNPTTIADAQAALDAAKDSQLNAQGAVDAAEEAFAQASNFMRAQANVAKCKTTSLHLSS